MKAQKIVAIFALFGIASLLFHSCNDDDNTSHSLLSLSKLEDKVKIGDYTSVTISLDDAKQISKIIVKKTIEGKEIASYQKSLEVAQLTFPYEFREQIVDGDENGTVVYSFYGQDAQGNVVDAADLVLTVELAEIPLLLKYDWMLAAETIQGENTATQDLTDDVHRFNPDQTWQVDWGSVFSDWMLETLNSYCSWQVTTDGSKVKTLSVIHYNIFVPSVPVITTYNVLQLSDRKMILESFQDLSAFGDQYSDHEQVLDVYVAVSKSSEFTPYRGSNPDSYYVESCNPGSY